MFGAEFQLYIWHLLTEAYILFTSGLTGLPKARNHQLVALPRNRFFVQGVILSHGNLLAYVRWHVQYYRLSPEEWRGRKPQRLHGFCSFACASNIVRLGVFLRSDDQCPLTILAFVRGV